MASHIRRWGEKRWVRWSVMGTALTIGWLWITGHTFSWEPRFDAEMITAGKVLFEHQWQPNDPLSNGGDGLGPVFNANSCVACHFQGGVGGAGPGNNNVLSFAVHPSVRDREFHSGVVHAAAVLPGLKESMDVVSQLFPIVPGGARIRNGCTINVADFNPVSFTQINTPALFGAGLIDRIPGIVIGNNQRSRSVDLIAREFHGDFTGIPAGRARILPDGRIGKFGWKSQFATLEEFVATACAVEVGLSNPMRKQDLPRRHAEDVNAKPDMTEQQLYELVAFCQTLPAPTRVLPQDSKALESVNLGEQLFTSVGCANCHTPKLGNVEGIYSDLLLHRIEDENGGLSYGGVDPEVPLPDDIPHPTEWKTAPLWGVADTAPYFHDGGAPSLEAAILRHAGHAKHSTAKFKKLSQTEQTAIIAFLKTLRAPQPASTESSTLVAAKPR